MALSFHRPPPLTHAPSVTSIAIRAASGDRASKDVKLKMIGMAVSATTQLLRLFSVTQSNNISTSVASEPNRNFTQFQDVVDAIRADYNQAYFLTGKLTRTLYADDCYFADPTISFTGTDLYERNLMLLSPFLEDPSLSLFSISKEPGEGCKIRAVWQLRTRLRLPWRPIICVAGSTIYTLDEQLKVVSHVEIWGVSVLEALSQIFRKGGNFS